MSSPGATDNVRGKDVGITSNSTNTIVANPPIVDVEKATPQPMSGNNKAPKTDAG